MCNRRKYRWITFLATATLFTISVSVELSGQVKATDPAGEQPQRQKDTGPNCSAQPAVRLEFRLNINGHSWEMLPGSEAAIKTCEEVVNTDPEVTTAGSLKARCRFLGCKWIRKLADCTWRAIDSNPGNNCTADDYGEIKNLEDEMSLVCQGLLAM